MDVATRIAVRERADERCEYCQRAQADSPLAPLQVEHIVPRKHGGTDDLENLALACAACNGHKADRTAARDPKSGRMVRLFNPRRQVWTNHFAWSDAADEIIGKTATGRATVQALHLNRAALVAARRAWVAVGWHPPAD